MRVVATTVAVPQSSVREAIEKMKRDFASEGLQDADRVVGWYVLDANGVCFAPNAVVCKSKDETIEAAIEELSRIPAALAVAAGELNPNTPRARAAAEQDRVLLAFPVTIYLRVGT